MHHLVHGGMVESVTAASLHLFEAHGGIIVLIALGAGALIALRRDASRPRRPIAD